MVTIRDREQILSEQLAYAILQGISIKKERIPCIPDMTANVCVREEAEEIYMPDYIMDDAGVVREIRYDKINELYYKP